MKKYTKEIIIIILVALLLSVWQCSHNNALVAKGEKKVLKEQLKKEKDGLKVFRERQKILFDSIFSAEKVKDKRIAELSKSNKELDRKLETTKKELQKKKDSYKDKTFEQLAQVFKEQGYENVVGTENSVNLEKDTPVAVLEDLAEGIACAEEVQVKNEVIKNKNEEIKLTQEKVLSRDLVIASKQIEIEQQDDIIQTQEQINEKSEKQIKSLQTKNFVKTLIIPASIIGGFLIGKEVAK